MAENILEVKNLKISFRTNSGTVKAVRNISFDLEKGKTMAIVGESGSGKSVTSKAIMGILAGNSIIEGGEILYDGKDLLKIDEEDMHRIRGDKIAMIFQDPLSSLDPIVKIGKQITEAMLLKTKATRRNGKKNFNNSLAELKKHMLAASDPSEAAKIESLLSTFNKFNIEGNKLASAYNYSESRLEDIEGKIKDTLFMIEKKAKINVPDVISRISNDLPSVKNRYLTYGFDDRLSAAVSKLNGLKKADESNPELKEALTEIVSVFEEIHKKEEPNFFRIGYYMMKKGEQSAEGMSNHDLNEAALQFLNADFMDEFLVYVKRGLRHSFDESIENKKKVVESFEGAKIYFETQKLEKSECKKYQKSLSEAVDASINRLAAVKDSLAYTFKATFTNAISRYFEYEVKNPKEEARFAKQTAKREKLIAAGKTVDWKVTPKNVYDLDDLRADIVEIITRLKQRYTADIENAASFDEDKEAIVFIDRMKDLAADAVYVLTKKMAREKAIKLMEEVGIPEPRIRYNQYPFEFSGGMRQRIVIAIALSANPDILICDEPTTALDVTIQAQILDLINNLKRERNLSVIFITHDLGVVANMADDIAVMYAGKIVEYGTADDIFYDPRHPYTWALLSSMPDLDTNEKLEAIPGTPPNMIYPPEGDAFAERNRYAMQIDFEQQPPEFRISDTHWAATWLLHPDAPKVEMPKTITERIARMTSRGADGE